jgi:hypothetical protein
MPRDVIAYSVAALMPVGQQDPILQKLSPHVAPAKRVELAWLRP